MASSEVILTNYTSVLLQWRSIGSALIPLLLPRTCCKVVLRVLGLCLIDARGFKVPILGIHCKMQTLRRCPSQYYVPIYILIQATAKIERKTEVGISLTSLAARTIVVNCERSPHSAKNVKVKA